MGLGLAQHLPHQPKIVNLKYIYINYQNTFMIKRPTSVFYKIFIDAYKLPCLDVGKEKRKREKQKPNP